ncbi:MAG: N-acetylmuramoyl-L-alanine amidase [Alphaproteobacteria bacterium]|nr:N-acetylmuramoyl-L-alanine amidase [Alphaproteobacteria bacterium]
MSALEIRDCPSPNHDARPAGVPIDILLLHYTGMPTAEAALARLLDVTAKVSAHYLIDEDGAVSRLVPEARRAWHAGVASWAGARDINGRSIGIELVNPGHAFGYRAFPAPQMAALAGLAQAILARHPIPTHRVLGHADVAPERKQDPGELFDWQGLAAAGIGLWPDAAPHRDGCGHDVGPAAEPALVARLQADLARFGYGVRVSGDWDHATACAVAAFQRHWRAAAITGIADAETRAILAGLLDQIAKGA